MAQIIPFRALRYNPRQVPDLARVVTPPYDVIAPQAQEAYHARHPQNVVRLVLARETPPDADGRDRYDRAARAYREWQAGGILVRDPAAALYLYEQTFALGAGPRLCRRGVLAGVRLEEYEAGVVLPHERTFAHHRDDRLRLMRACPANLEAILAFYAGPADPVGRLWERHASPPPTATCTDEAGTVHRLWAVTDGEGVAGFQGLLAGQPVFIADGHHRYETALAFRNERRGAGEGGGASDYVLAHLVHAEDPGLVVLPTHRILRAGPVQAGGALRRRLAARFDLTELPRDPRESPGELGGPLGALERAAADRPAFLLAAEGALLLLALREDPAAPGPSEAADRLHVAILHRLLIEEILGLATGPGTDDRIGYTRDPVEALEAARTGAAWGALLLTAPRVAEVQAVALAGGRMPQKSTYFFPKVLSGLVIRPLE